MTTRTRYSAKYLYPGAFFPESTFRIVEEPTFHAALAAAPAEEGGFFKADGWYAVEITAIHERRFLAEDDLMSEEWVETGRETVGSWIVGEKIHVDDEQIAGPKHDILRSNIRSNSRPPEKDYGVRTRCGNWQIASDYIMVVAPDEAVAR